MPRTSSGQGFTLVELAIVLVIIGLLVGGVLIGQDLIAASGIRGTVAQIESFNSAANTFRTKYHGLPGDITSSRAEAFDLTARAGTGGAGDGNSLLQNSATTAYQQGLGHETALFWRDLMDADLISGSFAIATDAPAASITTGQIPLYLPSTKMRQTTFFHVYAVGGRNYYYIGGFSSTPTDANGVLSLASSMSPQDARSMDDKMDDATGATGVMIAVSAITDNAPLTGTGGATDCLNANGSYNLDDADRDSITCRVTTRASF